MSHEPGSLLEDPILALRSLAYQSTPVVLTSTYKGLVLSQELKIIEVKPDRVVVQAPDHRIAVSLDGRTFLFSPALPGVISATVDDLVLERGSIILSDLAFTGGDWRKRYGERIHPQLPVRVDVRCRKDSFRGELENISTTGLKLVVYKLQEKGITIEEESALRLSFYLPGDSSKFDLKGSIVYYHQVGFLLKLGVKITPQPAQSARLRLYIASRIAEIMTELDLEVIAMREAPYVSSLFF
jgi:hypothetical protein